MQQNFIDFLTDYETQTNLTLTKQYGFVKNIFLHTNPD